MLAGRSEQSCSRLRVVAHLHLIRRLFKVICWCRCRSGILGQIPPPPPPNLVHLVKFLVTSCGPSYCTVHWWILLTGSHNGLYSIFMKSGENSSAVFFLPASENMTRVFSSRDMADFPISPLTTEQGSWLRRTLRDRLLLQLYKQFYQISGYLSYRIRSDTFFLSSGNRSTVFYRYRLDTGAE